MSDRSSAASSNSDSSYVFVDYPNKEEDEKIEIIDFSRSGDFQPLKMISSSINLEAGLLPHHSSYFDRSTSGKRRQKNFCRVWNSFSRFQKNLITAVLALTLCSFLFVYSSFYVRAKISSQKEAEHLEEDTYRKKAQFPMPNKDKLVIVDSSVDALSKDPLHKVPVHFTGPHNDKQKAVVEAYKHAWRGYKTYAWGHDHLKPISKSFHDWFGLGLTIVDNLDTMLIMGLTEEFNESRKWVATELDFNIDKSVNLFETTIRVLGGLLSTYYLTDDELFLKKAVDLGDRLLGAFDTPSKLPYSDVNLRTKQPKLPAWGPDSSLSEVTTIQLEFRALSRASKNPIYETVAFNVSNHIHKMGCPKYDGLCPMFINPKNGEWRSGYTITMGARADSYYEYLFKQWLQTGKTIDWLKTDYADSMKAMQVRLLRYSEPNKMAYIGEILNEKSFSPKMDHLVCYIVGTLALGAANGVSKEHTDLAKNLAHTCREMYRNPTGLGPEIAHFNMVPSSKDDIFVKTLDAHCLLRPEAIEGWFYLYRLTGEKIYQQWGWDAFQAIEKYAKVDNGYSSVSNVKKTPVAHKDMMESFFLAETLKYLFLLFADEDKNNVLPLDEYVFNTEAHPLPIYGN